MPALEAFPTINLVPRMAELANATADPAYQVICAWPVSGQYGPGSRILYYVLVAICVLARRADWLRNACLAAALLLPLVAALHGIVLATVHVDEAVDLDIYGAFQLCAIGVLVAPVAATLSRTYFKNPGRNAIVLWSLLVVAGLISLSVEFYRVSGQPVLCQNDQAEHPLSTSSQFPYDNANIVCGLRCSPEAGPMSPIRGGSADNIYVVPEPHVLSFNVCIMLTAACCIPAILLVAWMMVTSSHTNWTRRWGEQSSLTLKVPVQLYDTEHGMPPMEQLRQTAGSLTKLGIIGTQSYRLKRESLAPGQPAADQEDVEAVYNETVIDSSAASTNVTPDRVGVAGMLEQLHEESALSFYDFEHNGYTIQLLEIKLDAEYKDFARQLYAALRDMENEDVDMICVESVETEANTPNGRVMSWLRDEQDAEKGAVQKKRTRKEKERSPGTVILLAIFSLAVLSILVMGERNLFSTPVNYQTEPMANVGQWAPVAGTVLVVVGSIYVLIAEAMRKERRRLRSDSKDADQPTAGYLDRTSRAFIRRLIKMNDFFDAPRWLFDHSEFQKGQKRYPLIPGETWRNTELEEQITKYEPSRHSNESSRSRGSGRSAVGATLSRQPSRDRSPPDPAAPPPRKRTLTLPDAPDSPRPSRRRGTQNTSPGTPLEHILLNDAAYPTIIVSHQDEQATGGDGGVIR